MSPFCTGRIAAGLNGDFNIRKYIIKMSKGLCECLSRVLFFIDTYLCKHVINKYLRNYGSMLETVYVIEISSHQTIWQNTQNSTHKYLSYCEMLCTKIVWQNIKL